MVKRIWLDTDIGPDCDDAGALAILLEYCRLNVAELVCLTHCTSSKWGLPTAAAICERFGFQVPMGTLSQTGFLDSLDYLSYTPGVSKAFPSAYSELGLQPEGVATVIEALSVCDDHSVELIAIGPLRLVAQCFDDGVAGPLLHRKLSRIVLMGGSFEHTEQMAEWNFAMDPLSARKVVEAWQGDLLVCPFEAGHELITGSSLRVVPKHPVSLSYELYTKGTMQRPSWDLVAVYAALDSIEEYASFSPRGVCRVDAEGRTNFSPDEHGNVRYLRKVSLRLADKLEKLLHNACINS